MITTTLSIKNQITLPKFILDLLNIESGDKLLVHAEENSISLEPVGKSVVDSLAGSIKIPRDKKGVPFEKALSVTKKKVAQKLAYK